MSEQQLKVRIDKWLWAARFFKTRGIAKQMIEGGKVHYNGQRTKCSKLAEVGAELKIRQGFDEKTVVIVALSEQRRGAPEAQKLYRETDDSLAQREEAAVRRKLANAAAPVQRPSKKDRRKIRGFRDHLNNED